MENMEASFCCRDHDSGNENGAKLQATSIKLLKTDVQHIGLHVMQPKLSRHVTKLPLINK